MGVPFGRQQPIRGGQAHQSVPSRARNRMLPRFHYPVGVRRAILHP
jgi:hypothetical protein